MRSDRTWTLIAKKLTGNASVKESKELKYLLNSDPALEATFNTIEQLFFETGDKYKGEETRIAFDRLWKMIEYQRSLQLPYKKQDSLNHFFKS